MLGRIKTHQKDKGDTLVEVLFAVTVFSLVAVGGMSIMNQGTATSQRALEITLVRQEIDGQAETLRFLNASYISAYRSGLSNYPSDTPAGQWSIMQDSIIASGFSRASEFGTGAVCPAPPAGSFILNAKKATFIPPSEGMFRNAETFAQVRYETVNNEAVVASSDGIWIEAIRAATVSDNNQSTAGYTDFHIRACWDSPGQAAPVTLGTIVRLYEPRS